MEQKCSISISCLASLIWCICFLLLTNQCCCFANSNETDRIALLAIKSQLQDPLGATSSWNASVNMCRWTGVSCGDRHQRVTTLDLRNQSIGGFLSPYIGNLSFLRSIILSGNRFVGEIPNEVGNLFRLETLQLSNNSFSGQIPANMSGCSNLVFFQAGRNNLVGEIPAYIGYSWLKLELLGLQFNKLTGQLPPSMGNVSSLKSVDFIGNRLYGTVPDSFGLLRSLIYIQLTGNHFSGTFPVSLSNISSLESIFLLSNRFNGSLPLDIGSSLPNLKAFSVYQNSLTGPIPHSFSNASNLLMLDLSYNHFSGQVNIDFHRLPSLVRLSMNSNNLGTGSSAAADLDFLNLLTNCSKLQVVSSTHNRLGGVLPPSITNLSSSMIGIGLGGNKISGTIPPDIRKLVNLNLLGLEDNQLTGTLPHTIGELGNLQGLALVRNSFQGSIPDSIGNLSKLSILRLGFNDLQGSIPSLLANCQNLVELNLSNNKLTGALPPKILGIKTLSVLLDLSHNLLSGSIPLELGNLEGLVFLDLSGNHFSDNLPATLGSCTALQYLNMQENSFSGSIPSSLNSLKSIKGIDLSSNNLSGQIPKFLENLSFLEYLNLSYNHLEGQVPSKGAFSNKTRFFYSGNERLCGGIVELHLPACHHSGPKRPTHTLLKVVIPVVVSLLILSTCFIVVYTRRRKLASEPSPSMFSMEQQFPMVSYAALSKATNEFSSANIIGQGSFGCVYKGKLVENGMDIAVKVINLEKKGATKSFLAECEALRNIRHRNLIRIITVCSSIDFKGADFKALVYEYMQRGSLEDWLHQSTKQLEAGNLDLIQRLNLVIDVASGIEYLHHHCQPPIVHGDLKPSNVLLDDDMVAHVGDFGLARFLADPSPYTFSEGQSSSIGIKGTVGYVPPEYGMGADVSVSGDVYSFGILLLEMFTRRRPTDNMFSDGLDLHGFAKMALPGKVTEIVDPSLLMDMEKMGNPGNGRERIEECLICVLRTGVICSMDSATERMQMADVVAKLLAAREIFSGRSS